MGQSKRNKILPRSALAAQQFFVLFLVRIAKTANLANPEEAYIALQLMRMSYTQKKGEKLA